jgi:hypothetical protein
VYLVQTSHRKQRKKPIVSRPKSRDNRHGHRIWGNK